MATSFIYVTARAIGMVHPKRGTYGTCPNFINYAGFRLSALPVMDAFFLLFYINIRGNLTAIFYGTSF